MVKQTYLSLSKVLHTKKEKKTVLDNYITVNSRMYCCQNKLLQQPFKYKWEKEQ